MKAIDGALLKFYKEANKREKGILHHTQRGFRPNIFHQNEERLKTIRQKQTIMNNAFSIVRWFYRFFNIKWYAHHHYVLATLDAFVPLIFI